MKIKSAELVSVCGITSKLPDFDLPEVAFAGRSNVGKSSLINGLLNRKNLARTSSTPGKTVTINFYEINKEFFLVDLPGYGYAKTSMSERAKWGKMIEKYLNSREKLKNVFLLVDCRIEPTNDDKHMYQWITDAGFSPVIVVTKTDKLSKNQLIRSIGVIRKSFNAGPDVVILPFSALKRTGREEILDVLDKTVKDGELSENPENTENKESGASTVDTASTVGALGTAGAMGTVGASKVGIKSEKAGSTPKASVKTKNDSKKTESKRRSDSVRKSDSGKKTESAGKKDSVRKTDSIRKTEAGKTSVSNKSSLSGKKSVNKKPSSKSGKRK